MTSSNYCTVLSVVATYMYNSFLRLGYQVPPARQAGEISADGSFSRPIKGGYKDIDRIISYTVVIYYDRSSYLVE